MRSCHVDYGFPRLVLRNHISTMPLFDNIRKCVTRRQGLQRRRTKVLFNVKLSESFKSMDLPSQLKDLLVYIARDGVTVVDLFRRPGNPRDMKQIIADLECGRPIDWKMYSFYTLANIAKRYLLHIRGGLLGPESEARLIELLESPDDQMRIEAMHSVIVSQPKPVQQLLALFFGIWFRMIYHTEVNAMSVEAVAKSVAGSVFPSSTTSPERVERASKVMEYLITGFASADLFSRELIEYFTSQTQTSISRLEKFKYEFRFPRDVPREISARLFTQLLQEESEKHGFDLINDAVSKETFENANWDTVHLHDHSSNQRFSNDTIMETPTRMKLPVPPSDPLRLERSDGLSVSVTPPTSARRLSNNNMSTPSVWGSFVHEDARNPVQQLSEKRTCVTATPLPGDAPAGAFVVAAQGKRDFDQLYTMVRSFEPEVVAQSTPRQVACFSAVKRRQLERLQKRSDWFLSPPAGLRASGRMMHLDPNSSSHGSTPLRDQNARFGQEQPNQYLRPNLASDTASKVNTGYPNPALLGRNIPAATSSPLTRLDFTDNKPGSGVDDKENFSEVEVRYFLVERYYGPEPRTPFTKVNPA